MDAHRFKPEATNAGHYFSDCSCGWQGGVYPGRVAAREAWECHYDHRPIPPHVPVTVLLGEPTRGMAVRRAPRRGPIAPRNPDQVIQVTPGSTGMPKWTDLLGIDPALIDENPAHHHEGKHDGR